jgi:hypothetical protein
MLVQHQPNVSFPSVFGERAQLAYNVPVNEVVASRTKLTGVVGHERLHHVLGAVLTLGRVLGEDALVSREAQALGDVADNNLARSDKSLVMAAERRTRSTVRRLCHASSRESVVVEQRVSVLDAGSPAVGAVVVEFVLLERTLPAPAAHREISDGARLLSDVAHALENRDCSLPHGGVALENHP